MNAPSLALQSKNNNRHPRSNAAKTAKNLQKYPLKPCREELKLHIEKCGRTQETQEITESQAN